MENKVLIHKPTGYWTREEMRSFFAFSLTVVLMVLFAPPFILSLHIALDTDVAYFVGRGGLVALLMPIFILFLHIHNQRSPPQRGVIGGAFMLPAVLFAAIGGVYMTDTKILSETLSSDDCGNIVAKAELQDAWGIANDLYSECLTDLGMNRNGVETHGRKPPSVMSCDNYRKELTKRRTVSGENDLKEEWAYLAYTEYNYVCAGFCEGGQPLWYRTLEPKDACGQFVAQKFKSVQHQATMLLSYSIIVMGVYLFGGQFVIARALKDQGHGYVDTPRALPARA